MKRFIIGNSKSTKKHEIFVDVEAKTVRTNNQKIRNLIKDFLNNNYINQGDRFYSPNLMNNYCILDFDQF